MIGSPQLQIGNCTYSPRPSHGKPIDFKITAAHNVSMNSAPKFDDWASLQDLIGNARLQAAKLTRD